MAGVLALLYGGVCYLIAFLTLIYAIAFVGDLPVVPKTINSGEAGPLAASLLIDALLLGLFAVQHSVMARPAFKAWWSRFVPTPIERSTYILAASAVLILTYWQWRPVPQLVWSLDGVAALILVTGFWLGWVIVFFSSFLISHFELFGLSQVWSRFRGLPPPAAQPLRTPLLYGLVRHPIYLGLLLAFWCTPTMTIGHLFFAIGGTGYIFIGIHFEERDLVGHFGEAYVAYRRRVSMILPLPPRG
jgi:protein-S-isoprenylcysteine O-methyltransferase Ste14